MKVDMQTYRETVKKLKLNCFLSEIMITNYVHTL